MSKSRFLIATAFIAATFTVTSLSHAQQAAATKTETQPATKDDGYDKNLEKARSSAEAELKEAQAIKAEEDKKKAAEAEKQKQQLEAAETERKIREKEQAERLAEEKRKAAIEDKRRRDLERERSCAIKPVMTDAEIANCKQVWKK